MWHCLSVSLHLCKCLTHILCQRKFCLLHHLHIHQGTIRVPPPLLPAFFSSVSHPFPLASISPAESKPTLFKIGTSTDTASCLATCPTPVCDPTTDPFNIFSQPDTSLSSNSREQLRKTSSHMIIGLFNVQSACPKAVDIHDCITEKTLDLLLSQKHG